MHANEMRYSEIAYRFAPSQNEKIGVVVDGSYAMAHSRTHGKAFKRKDHKNQHTQSNGPEVVGWELRKRLGEKLESNKCGVKRNQRGSQSHHRKEAGIQGGTGIVVGDFPFSGHDGNVDDFKSQKKDDRPVKQGLIESSQVMAIPSHSPSKKEGGEGKLEGLYPSIDSVNLCGRGFG